MIRELFLEDLSLWSCVWQSTLLGVIGLVGSFLLRRRPARAFQVLFLAMIAAVIVPAMSVAVKHFELGAFVAKPVALQPASMDLYSAMPFEAPAAMTEPQVNPEVHLDAALAEGGTGGIDIPWRAILLLGWMAASLALLGRLLTAFINGVRLIRRSRPEVREHIQQALNRARARLPIAKNLQIRASGEIHSPMIWCWSRTAVLLVPCDLNNNVDWVGVICHELAHCTRRDHISGLVAELTTCILCWNPLSWLAKKRLIRLGEQACDDWVVAGGQPVENYARSLLNFKPQKQAAFVPAVVHSRKGVAARVRRILEDTCVNPRTGALWALTVSIMTAGIAIGVACAQTRPAKPESPSRTEKKPTRSLQEASIDGDIEQVKLNLSAGADVNAKDNKGRTALHRAAGNDHLEIARLLIANGADVNARNQTERTPLHNAANSDGREMAELLILKGADVNAEDESGQTPLSRALHNKSGGREMVELLVSKGAIIPALHLAAHRGQLETIKENLGDRANVDARDEGGRTLLHYAASAGHAQVVELLVARGADVDAKDKRGETPLYYAADTGSRNVAELLIAAGADVNIQQINKGTPLHEAAGDGSIDVVELLIAHGANLDAKDVSGYTPLHYTAWYKDLSVLAAAKLLLDKGAEVNARNNWDGTPLTDAAESDNLALAKLLVERGANVNAACVPYGCTCLHHAVASKDVTEFLIAKGADVNKRDRNGQTPLHSAVLEGSRDSVELLIAKGADINAKNKWGRTPLDVAVKGGRIEIMRLLLKHGAKSADVGTTPLHQAASVGDITEVKAFLSQGADINAKDDSGQTPLHLAANRGDKEMVEVLIANGAHIEARENRYSSTPLLNAAVRGQKEVVELLLAKGADIEGKNSDGLTPLHLTAGYGTTVHTDVILLLLDKGADIETRGYGDGTPLQTAVAVGRRQVAELLLARGAKVDGVSKHWGTPANHAMRENHADLVHWCIEKGVDVPPMHRAAYFGETDKVRSLLSGGAEINQKDKGGFTPLHCAIFGRQKEVVQLLLNNGADVKARSCGDATALFWACDRGYLDMVKLLLDNGADVNSRALRKMTWGSAIIDDLSALHMAAHAGHSDVVEYLLDKGADIHARCTNRDEGLTPLHMAARNGHVEAIRVLLARGADASLKSKEGHTALDFAKERNHTDVVELLTKHGAKQ